RVSLPSCDSLEHVFLTTPRPRLTLSSHITTRQPPAPPLSPYTTLFRSGEPGAALRLGRAGGRALPSLGHGRGEQPDLHLPCPREDRKSTRLNPVTVASRMPSSA